MEPTMTDRQTSAPKTIPANSLPLNGRALIEASAGTGKTWTLTGIILRLLIEAKYPAKEIIASTFTRAAAAEMRQRIQLRVQQFRQLLVVLLLKAKEEATLLNDDQQLLTRIEDFFQQEKIDNYFDDDVNRGLLRKIVQQDGLDGLLLVYRLSELALADLNKMFVGTLDSLCQKWLCEFAIET
ncbi:MAG: DNA helicase UvrD, partial [Cardiobacteriales bacterium]